MEDKPAYTLTISELRNIIREEINRSLTSYNAPTSEKAEDELLTIAALANHLGVSKQTIHTYRIKGFLPAPSYIGTRPRWSRNEVDEFMKGAKVVRRSLRAPAVSQ